MVQPSLIKETDDELINVIEGLIDDAIQTANGQMNPTFTKADVERILRGIKNKLPQVNKDNADEVLTLWNSTPQLIPSGIPVRMTKKRQGAIKERWRDQYFRKHFRTAIKKLTESPFCMGENSRNWRANIDWFLRPDTVTSIIEGKYDGKTKRNSATGASEHDNGF